MSESAWIISFYLADNLFFLLLLRRMETRKSVFQLIFLCLSFYAFYFHQFIYSYLYHFFYLYLFLAVLQTYGFVNCKTKQHRIHICNVVIYRVSECQAGNLNRKNKTLCESQQQHKTGKKTNWIFWGRARGNICNYFLPLQ